MRPLAVKSCNPKPPFAAMAPKKSDETLAKEAAKAAKKAAEKPTGTAASSDGASAEVKLTSAEQTKMLNFMKYRADPEKNKSGEGCEAAREGLELYMSLTKEDKKEFVAEFLSRGKKDLKWMMSFKRSMTGGDREEVGSNEKYLTLTAILELNGLRVADPFNLSDAAKETALQLVADNEAEHKHKMPPQIHPKLEALNKYYYVQDTGLAKKRFRGREEVMAKWTDNAKACKDDIDKDGRDGGETDVEVKQEHPLKQVLVQKSAHLKKARGKLQTVHQAGMSTLSKLIVRSRKDENFKEHVTTMEKAMDEMSKFMDAVSLLKAEVDAVEDPDDMDKLVRAAATELGKVDLHMEACSEACKKFNKKLNDK